MNVLVESVKVIDHSLANLDRESRTVDYFRSLSCCNFSVRPFNNY